MELHGATLAKCGLAIKFIILIEISGPIYINKIIELIFKFKSKLSENKKYI
jgi:hypothetical protein